MNYIQKLVKRLGSQEISRKILIVLLVVSVVPIFCIQFISYKISTSIVKEQTGKLILANLEQSANSVQDFFGRYDEVMLNILSDEDYVRYMQPINLWNGNEYFSAKHELISRLQNITYVNKDLLGVAIVDLYGGSVFYDSVTLSGARSYCFNLESMREDLLVRRSLEEKQTLYSKTFHKSDEEYGEYYYLYIVHQLTDFNNYQEGPVGSILICVEEEALGQVYNQGQPTDSNITFLTNQEGDIVSFPDKSFIGENLFSLQENGKLDNASPYGSTRQNLSGEASIEQAGLNQAELNQAALDYVRKNIYKNVENLEVNSRSIQGGSFYIINVQDLNETLSNVKYITIITILIGLLVGIICILVAISFSHTTDKAVKKILNAMKKVYKGDYDVQIAAEDNGDEFAQISQHFNDMIYKVKRSNAQEREALIREKNAEIKSLEAQINPHFLYNTLDAINWVAIDHEEFTISRMLTSLAVILRYSVHKSNEIVEISSELEYLKKYVYLQQQRFDYSFQCVLNVEEEVLQCRIHKLLIQPLIENAIVHGFPGSSEMDEINLDIRQNDKNDVEIIVRDNGKGMKAELVETLNHFDYQENTIQNSIGIRNVITRVKLYYGAQGSFHMESGEAGTEVRITIPHE